mmetsp:Transcript_5376/g.6538  ORF Transcript_5376/g.6538 Transcript_5376/m.6538 type:complete len:290 (-) Transcript_5376:67-936(-)
MLLKIGDVDDDLSILWTLASNSSVHFLGLTATFGNSVTQRTFHDATELLYEAGSSLTPQYGANYFKRDLSTPTNASRFIIDTILASNEPVTVVCIGATTNLAAALTQEPSIANNIKQILLNGGDISNPPFAELLKSTINFYFDIEATSFLFSAPIPKVIFPIQVMIQSAFTKTQVQQLSQCNNSVAYASLDRITKHQQMEETKMYENFGQYPEFTPGGFFPWDVYPSAYLSNPELYGLSVPYNATVDHGVIKMYPDPTGDCKMVLSLTDSQKFIETLVAKLCSVPLVNS